MTKRTLKTGVAQNCLAGLAIAGLSLSGWAFAGVVAAADSKPVVPPPGAAFQAASQRTAGQTVQLVQAGTTPAQPAIVSHDLPELSASRMSATGELICPCEETDPALLSILPEEIRRTAKPGDCFARLLTSPKFESFTDKVLIQEARTETRTVPEVARMVDQQVVVTPARVATRVIPAVTRQVTATEVVTPETYREEVIPAVFETRRERVMVRAEQEVWVKTAGIPTGAALITAGDYQPVRYRADGTLSWPGKSPTEVATHGEATQYLQQGSAQDVWCLKVLPAEFETRETRVEVRPAQTRRIVIPAVTRQVTRTEVVTPERTESYTIPAVVETRKVREIVTPARTESFAIPAQYRDETRQRVIEEPRAVWRPVLCDKNATPETIKLIQRALMAKGYSPGSVDGQLGPQTMSAMQKFQADNGLPQGQVSIEAVKLLGVTLPAA